MVKRGERREGRKERKGKKRRNAIAGTSRPGESWRAHVYAACAWLGGPRDSDNDKPEKQNCNFTSGKGRAILAGFSLDISARLLHGIR